MKLRKKTIMAVSFALGTLMFATTAMAEVNSKSGYDQFKDAVKYTAKQTTTGFSSYTLNQSVNIKDGDSIVYSSNTTSKYDVINKAMENVTEFYNGKDKNDSYFYNDKNTQITKAINDKAEAYYSVTNFTNENTNIKWLQNPFEQDKAADMEKIADALVGNIKDAVVFTAKSDGNKELSGSINNTQIPSIVNALASFQFKNSYGNGKDTNFSKMPKLIKDIYVKNAKGNVITDKNGLIKTAAASGVLSGKDKNNTVHNLTFEVSFNISNINSTKVSKPDLTGKKVQETTTSAYDYSKLTNPEKYIGKYKSNIVEENDGKFIKIGEAIVIIEKMNTDTVSGTYETKYVSGYEDRNKKLNFTGKFHKEKNHSPFDAEVTLNSNTEKNIEGSLYVPPDTPSINFHINGEDSKGFDANYNKIFD